MIFSHRYPIVTPGKSKVCWSKTLRSFGGYAVRELFPAIFFGQCEKPNALKLPFGDDCFYPFTMILGTFFYWVYHGLPFTTLDHPGI